MAFFIPDLSSWEGNAPNFDAIAAAPNMVGCIIKASEGISPGVRIDLGHSPTWFKDNWQRVRAAGGSRYGTNWFRGCYHFGTPTPGGDVQADYLLTTVDRAGGWGDGDLAPAWDLEGKLWTSQQQIIDVSSAFAARIQQRLGRAPILYTGSVWRQFSVKDKAGFGAMWSPHLNLMEPFGWPNSSYVLWQYVGDGKYWNPATAMFGYPTNVPGLDAKVDMNVVIDGGAPATSIDRVRTILTGRGGGFMSSGRGGVSVPLIVGVGAGLLALGLMIAGASRDELV
jgi:GH25 family lysozyme M1 (1,4-beta-N-acetylmuramidase)